MARKRILQIFNRYLEYGGEEGSVYRIGDALQQIHDVEYLLGSSHELLTKGLTGKAVALVKIFHNQTMVNRLRRYQKIGHFDFWQIHNVLPAMSPAVYETGFKMGIPIVHYLHNYRMSCVNGFFLNHGEPCQLCIHGNFVPAFQTKCWHESHLQSGMMGIVLNRLRQIKVFEKITRWIAISEAQKKEHVRMGIPEGRISVVHHFFEATNKVLPLTGEGHALFVGRLSREKGISQLLRAWKLLGKTPHKLFIVGDGPEREKLETQVADDQIAGVIFTGFLKAEEQVALWERAAFLVVPSVWLEPFGMVVLEAWAKGRPVIANRLGALPELVDHGVNGLLVDANIPETMAAAIEELLNNPAKTREMGLRGREKLEAQFNKQKWIRQMEQLYADLELPYAKGAM